MLCALREREALPGVDDDGKFYAGECEGRREAVLL